MANNEKLTYKTSLVKLGFLYKIKKFSTKIIFAVFIGIVISLSTTLFIKSTSLYTGGTSSFFLWNCKTCKN